MHELSPLKKIYYSYLGWTYYWAYRSTLRRFLGARWSDWIRLLTLALIPALWLLTGRFPWLATALAIWVRFVYYRAERAGYSRFVPDTSISHPGNEITPISANKHIKARATGVFSLSTRENGVLLRPTEYWQIPLGDHIIMVEQTTGRYLYQFFNATTLIDVQLGWLIFGAEPMDALAITFYVTWGPDNNRDSLLYFVGGGQGMDEPTIKRTVYLTFESEEDCQAVWHNIIHDARRARAELAANT